MTQHPTSSVYSDLFQTERRHLAFPCSPAPPLTAGADLANAGQIVHEPAKRTNSRGHDAPDIVTVTAGPTTLTHRVDTMTTMARVYQAAERLQRAWSDAEHRLVSLPPELHPQDIGTAYAVQQAVSSAMGAIGGWKVLSAGHHGNAVCAPVPLSFLRRSGARIPWREWPSRRLRVALCFRLATSLANYDAPYSIQQAAAAIGTCHVGTEAIQSRFLAEPPPTDLAFLADSLSCGPLVTGIGTADWQRLDLARLSTRVLVNRREVLRRDGSAEFDIRSTLQWLAERGASWAGGPMVGHMIEIGVQLDPISVPSGAQIQIEISGVGNVMLQAGADTPPAQRSDR